LAHIDLVDNRTLLRNSPI